MISISGLIDDGWWCILRFCVCVRLAMLLLFGAMNDGPSCLSLVFFLVAFSQRNGNIGYGYLTL